MREFKTVTIEFVNKKGLKKKVKFKIENELKENLNLLTEAEREKYLKDLYHETERDKYHRRKYVLINDVSQAKSDIETPEEKYFNDLQKAELEERINRLTTKEQDYIRQIHYEGKKQKDLASKYGVDKSTVSRTLKRIYDKLKK